MIAPTPRAQRMAEFDFAGAYRTMAFERGIRDRAYERQAEFPAAEQVASDADARFDDLRAVICRELARLTGLTTDQLSEVL